MTTAKKSAKAPANTKKAAAPKNSPSLVEESLAIQIGIRELRQDASRVIALVQAGASITITKHGKPVAILNPPKKSQLDIWMEQGLITPAKKTIDFRNWKPSGGPAPQELWGSIVREREESRY